MTTLRKQPEADLATVKKSRDYLVTMVLHHNFMLRVCTAYCIVGYSPPLSIEQFQVTSQLRRSFETCGKSVWHLYRKRCAFNCSVAVE